VLAGRTSCSRPQPRACGCSSSSSHTTTAPRSLRVARGSLRRPWRGGIAALSPRRAPARSSGAARAGRVSSLRQRGAPHPCPLRPGPPARRPLRPPPQLPWAAWLLPRRLQSASTMRTPTRWRAAGRRCSIAWRPQQRLPRGRPCASGIRAPLPRRRRCPAPRLRDAAAARSSSRGRGRGWGWVSTGGARAAWGVRGPQRPLPRPLLPPAPPGPRRRSVVNLRPVPCPARGRQARGRRVGVCCRRSACAVVF